MKPLSYIYDRVRVSLAEGVAFSKRVPKHNSERNFFGNLFAKKGDILK
jgi:hypothetical protein